MIHTSVCAAADELRRERKKKTKNDATVRLASLVHKEGREGVEAEWERSVEFHEAWKLKVRRLFIGQFFMAVVCCCPRSHARRRLLTSSRRHCATWQGLGYQPKWCLALASPCRRATCWRVTKHKPDVAFRVAVVPGHGSGLAPSCRRATCWRARSGGGAS